MKCSSTPGGGASTTGHRSRTKKSRSSASIASQSSAHARPSPSRRRFDAIQLATSGSIPPATSPSIASARVATRCGSARTRPSIRHAVPAGSPGAGVESAIQTCEIGGAGPSASSDSATLPPKECPTTAPAGAGQSVAVAIS